MAVLTPQQQYEMAQQDKVEHSTRANTQSSSTPEANSQSQASNETPTQSANEEVITETPDYGNYSEPTDFSFLDGSDFQIGKDTSKDFVADYNRDLYEIARALSDEDLGESTEQVKNYLEKYKSVYDEEPITDKQEKDFALSRDKIKDAAKKIIGEDASYEDLEKWIDAAQNDKNREALDELVSEKKNLEKNQQYYRDAKKNALIQAYKNGEIDLGLFQKKLEDEITVAPIKSYDAEYLDEAARKWDEMDPNKKVELIQAFLRGIDGLYDNKVEELDNITFDVNYSWSANPQDAIVDPTFGLEEVTNKVSDNIETFSKGANKLLIDMMGDFVDWTEDKYKEFYNSKEFDNFRNKILQYGQAAKEKINQIRTEAERIHAKKGKLKQIRYNVERALNKVGLHTKLSNDEAYNIDSWLRSLDASESVAESLIASAAWNGAEDIKGSEYVEDWKNEVNQFFNEKSILAAGARGALGLLATTVGFGLLAVNPALAAVTIGIGAATFGSSSGKIAIGQEQKEASNRDIMFNPNKKKSIELYNRLYAPYNIGDTRAISTYTELAAAAAEAANGLASLISNPLGGAIMLADAGKKAKRLWKGGTDAKLDEMYQNVFNAAIYFDNAFGTDLESRFDINIEENTDDDENKTTSSSFDIDTNSFPVEGKYSGYRENAKNSNIAKNYNAGMEEESNEVVSDKYCKIFKTMLDKEPDYIRKVLIAIPKNHAESEW